MSALLESYVAGGWFAADDEGQPLLDAATGEEGAERVYVRVGWRLRVAAQVAAEVPAQVVAVHRARIPET